MSTHSGNGFPPPDERSTTAQAVPGTIAGRFRVIEPLGAGGMGQVFLARDTSLKREVAIKVLSAKLASEPRFAEQLLREARAIAQLHHPHIATVYDVVEESGTLSIVMEYVRGETLARRLDRAPLARRQALRYGREIASALAHAHARGIVHCDLKPANIVLTEDDDVKVLDFGLARLVSRHPGEPTEGIGASPAIIGSRAGTPAYMSPEQKAGLPLDHRSDIYSFGIVLREMVTGSAASGATGEPTSHVDALTSIVERAVAPSRERRFQTVEEIEAALRELAPGASPSRSRPQYVMAVAAAAAIAAASVALVRSRPAGGNGSGPAVIGVARFMSSPDDPSLSYLAAGLSDVAATDLGASNAVVVARSDRLAGSPDEAAAVARDLGAGVVILGRVEREDGLIAVTVRRFSASGETLSAPTAFRRPAEDLAAIRRALAEAIVTQLGSTDSRLRALLPSPERGLPSSMDAFEDYAQARLFLERNDVPANVGHAMDLLERLVAREPSFALGHAALGEATWRKWQTTKDPKWSEAALRHAFEALRLAADQPDVRYAVALLYQGTGRQAEALAEIEHVVRIRPTSDDAQRLMGRLYAETGRLDEGLAALRRAVALRPGYWGNHAALGNVAFRAGRYAQAITAFERYSELRPDSASAHQRLGTAHHAAGNREAALRSYERALAIAPNANAYSNVGTLHFSARRYTEAARAYTRAVELEPRHASLRRNLADAMARAGDARGAREQYGRAVALAAELLRVNPKDASALSLKAVGLARTGHVPDALTASATAVRLAPRDVDVLLENALILKLAGREAAAVDALVRAVGAGYNPNRLEEADPDLAALAQQPGFRTAARREQGG